MKWENKGGSDFDPAPAGTRAARCIQLIDLGTTYNEMFKNEQRKVYIGFELPSEINTWTQDGQEYTAPYTVGKFYTMSLNEKANLRKDMESWRGKEFTSEELENFKPKTILGTTALLSIIHKERQGKSPRADIVSITKIMKGMQIPPLHHEIIYFSFDEFKQDEFDKVPKGFQNMIKNSNEWKAMNQHNNNPDPSGRDNNIYDQSVEPSPAPAPVGANDFDDDIPF